MKVIASVTIVILFAIAPATIAQTPRPPVTEESIRAYMQLHVCKDSDGLEAVKSLFKKMGAVNSGAFCLSRVDAKPCGAFRK